MAQNFREDIFDHKSIQQTDSNSCIVIYSPSINSLICSKSAQCSIYRPDNVSFYWSLARHCVVKWIPPPRYPACHSANNKSNKHGKRTSVCCFFCFFSFQFWMQTLWFRIHLLPQSCGTDSVCMKCYCTFQATHFWQSMKGYCFFFVLPLLHCLSFGVCFLVVCFFLSVLCLDCFQTGQDNVGEFDSRMALHMRRHDAPEG